MTDAELAAMPDTLVTVNYPDNPVGAVLAACKYAPVLMAHALKHGRIKHLVALKGDAEKLRVYTRRERLGRVAVLAAEEVVRRAERAVGLAIRRGQAAGEIETRPEAARRASEARRGRGDGTPSKPRMVDFLPKSDLSSSHGDIFDLTDGVTDEQFETALAAARVEVSLSRANVIRKIQGLMPPPPRPEHLRKMRHFDPNRIVEQTILDSGLDAELSGQINYRDLDRDRLEEWISSLSSAIKSLTTLKRNLKKELNREQA